MIYDIHSHLNSPKLQSTLKEIITELETKDIHTNVVGYDLPSSRKAIEIASLSPNIYAIVGVHPDETDSYNEIELESLINNPQVVAIGECGFDFFHHDRNSSKDKQGSVFRSQIELSIKHNIPLMLHVRPTKDTFDAYEDTLEVLDKYPKVQKANFHFFAGNLDVLNEIIKRNFSVSYTGVITFAKEYEELVKNTPLCNLHAETDAPYVAPVPFRGQLCTPAMVIKVIEKIAQIKDQTLDEVKKQLNINANQFFSYGKQAKK